MAKMINEFVRTISQSTLENGPRTVDVEATAEECSAIAERLSLESLTSLTGFITLEIPTEPNPVFEQPVINGQGTLKATLTQTCVVTLEPFETKVESRFSGVFSNDDPAAAMVEDDDDDGGLDIPDVLGPIVDETIHIGEVFVEQLALEIHPFPRKPGAEFEGFSSGSTEVGGSGHESPFAVLEKLKDNL